mmetsp:Transcript_22416/g.69349  ORF Transcript_22416/g.69349 Transcript_22416/m.69349 type:complete len:202 (+) Transcript_22416:946-1551(+)
MHCAGHLGWSNLIEPISSNAYIRDETQLPKPGFSGCTKCTPSLVRMAYSVPEALQSLKQAARMQQGRAQMLDARHPQGQRTGVAQHDQKERSAPSALHFRQPSPGPTRVHATTSRSCPFHSRSNAARAASGRFLGSRGGRGGGGQRSCGWYVLAARLQARCTSPTRTPWPPKPPKPGGLRVAPCGTCRRSQGGATYDLRVA